MYTAWATGRDSKTFPLQRTAFRLSIEETLNTRQNSTILMIQCSYQIVSVDKIGLSPFMEKKIGSLIVFIPFIN
jgi:hypothetical protein